MVILVFAGLVMLSSLISQDGVTCANSLPVTQAWFNRQTNARDVNATTLEVLKNVYQTECLNECLRRRKDLKFKCSFVNYHPSTATCELCDASGTISTENGWQGSSIGPATDCSELYQHGVRESGVYNIYPRWDTMVMTAYCDMKTDGGGWTVFQRRMDGSQDFYLGWQAYKEGFGTASKEYWLGNDNLHYMTGSSEAYELRIEMKDFDGASVVALYSSFSVGDESSHYKLSVSGYDSAASTVGDSFTRLHNGMSFTTIDSDHDKRPTNCARDFSGAWWHRTCHESNLNGRYLGGSHEKYGDGVNWKAFRGFHYSLKLTEMKIRPVGFKG